MGTNLIDSSQPKLPAKRGRKQIVTDQQISDALELEGGLQSFAAKRLGIAPQSLSRRIRNSKKLISIVNALRKELVDEAARSIRKQAKEGSFKANKLILECFGRDDGWMVAPIEQSISSEVKIYLPKKSSDVV